MGEALRLRCESSGCGGDSLEFSMRRMERVRGSLWDSLRRDSGEVDATSLVLNWRIGKWGAECGGGLAIRMRSQRIWRQFIGI